MMVVLALTAGLAVQSGRPPRGLTLEDLGLSEKPTAFDNGVLRILINPLLNDRTRLDQRLQSLKDAINTTDLSSRVPDLQEEYTGYYWEVKELLDAIHPFLAKRGGTNTLREVLKEVETDSFELLCVDARSSVAPAASQGTASVETEVTFSLYEISINRDGDKRWVAGCRLLYEDTSKGVALKDSSLSARDLVRLSAFRAIVPELTQSICLSKVAMAERGRAKEGVQ